LKSFMDGLSAKVFRTYNASATLDRWFKEKPVDLKASLPDKLAYFNKANTEVAILCNHQKSVSKNFRSQMTQLTTKSSYTRKIIELLERAQGTAEKKSLEEAAKQFFVEHDRMQMEWLEAYGTPEQMKDFKEIVAKRGAPRQRVTTVKKPKASHSTKKSKSKSKSAPKKKKPQKGAATSSRKTTKQTKSAAAKKKSAKKGGDSRDDESLAAIAARKKSSKVGVKRARGAKEEDSDDDDIPLAVL